MRGMTEGFPEFARRPDEALDLIEGALLIAREAYPALDVSKYRTKLDRLGEEALREMRGRPGPAAAVESLNEFLFGRAGFRGNNEDYYDPRNSYINDVLDRRLGIPITLSILYCAVARRVGLSAAGVGFPGRYLVKCAAGRREMIIDCFDGRLLERRDCQKLLDSMYGGRLRLSDEMLRDSGPRETLARVLNNLKGVYFGRRDFDRAGRFVELSEGLLPGLPEHSRDRGMVFLGQEQFGKALERLEEYLRLAPKAPDAPTVRRHVRMTRTLLCHLN
jgi:regulator of sirC expression with transglutaminase-like and TPR domain